MSYGGIGIRIHKDHMAEKDKQPYVKRKEK